MCISLDRACQLRTLLWLLKHPVGGLGIVSMMSQGLLAASNAGYLLQMLLPHLSVLI